LSREAVMEYARIKGWVLHTYVEKWSALLYAGKPYDPKDKELIKWPNENYKVQEGHGPTPFYSFNPDVKTWKDLGENISFYEHDIKRDDPVLVETVKRLGDKSWGYCSELKIVEIPDGVKWQIEEYDGIEWVAEKHRTWR